MQGNPSAHRSTLRPSQASAAELVAGGSQIAIPAQQPLDELTQAPVKEYALVALPHEIDREEAQLMTWALANHRFFDAPETAAFEKQAGPKGGGTEHDAWVVMSSQGKVVIRRTINDSYGFRFRSPFQYLRRMADFSAQVPCAAVRFLGVSKNHRGNGVVWTVQTYIEGCHPSQNELVAELNKQGWWPVRTRDNHMVFEHAPLGVRMHDVHAGNFIRQNDGSLVPIDVFFEGIP